MAKRNVGLKLQAVQSNIAKLNPARREFWGRKLATLAQRATRVSGDAASDVEWDLRLANELDRIYTAVAQEATRTRKEFVLATAEATQSIGWGLWPLAIAALAFGIALSKGRSR